MRHAPLLALLLCVQASCAGSASPTPAGPSTSAASGAAVHGLAVDPGQLSALQPAQQQELGRQALQALGLHEQLMEQRVVTARAADDPQWLRCLQGVHAGITTMLRVGEKSLQAHERLTAAGERGPAEHELRKLIMALAKGDELQQKADHCPRSTQPQGTQGGGGTQGAGQTTVEVEVIAPGEQQ